MHLLITFLENSRFRFCFRPKIERLSKFIFGFGLKNLLRSILKYDTNITANTKTCLKRTCSFFLPEFFAPLFY